MKSIKSVIPAVVLVTIAALPMPALSGSYNVDANASVVKLRTSCTEGSAPVVTLDNCFDDSADLNSWIESERLPGPGNPLLVEIGPGAFPAFDLRCIGGTPRNPIAVYPGHVTLRGSGTDQTFIEAAETLPWTISGCAGMTFSDFTFRGPPTSYSTYISWVRGGSSVWRNVDVIGWSYAWRENGGSSPGTHYWFNSRLKVVQTASASVYGSVYQASGDKSWFFGSELTFDCTAGCAQGGAVISTMASAATEVHVYGSVLRALGGGTGTPHFTAALASGVGEIHIHGTGIDLLTPTASGLLGLSASGSGRIHADGAAFNMSTGPGGTITRVLDQSTSGHGIHAPYLWQGHDNPPSIISSNGADVAVVNDPAGPRFVIYNNACPSKWYDVGNNACRP